MASYRCLGCREYRPRPEFRRVGLGAVCSLDCLNTARQNSSKKSSVPVAPNQPSATTRAVVAERDGHRCRFCGLPATHLHHIAYRSEGVDHSATNLITLCPEHHSKVHTDKGRWQRVCMVYVAEVSAGRRRFLPDLDRELRG